MKLMAKIGKAVLTVILLTLPAAAQQDLGEGSMQVVSTGTQSGAILTLKRTEVKADISGFAAEVTVTQVFGNPAKEAIEAVYVFPLPENAAVNELTLYVADRVIKGQIKKREEARQVYEQARAEGKTAALLDQERPNIFTQSVANIPPGHEIKVTLKYQQDLAYDKGEYRFHFPMTVGPRYIPGAQAGRSGTGWSADTAQVLDASRITPPVVKPGQRSGRDITVQVRLNPGVAVKNLRSASHKVSVQGAAPVVIELDTEDRIPNKDFLLAWQPAAKMVDAAVLAHKDGRDGYLTLMVQPSADFPLGQVTAKELVIAIDVSGSMSGFPVETAKAAALRCLEGMNPGDTFQIMSFASGNQLHFERPLANTALNRARAREVINSLSGGGGTEMLAALGKALEFEKDPARLRIVLFMTDGYIGNEAQILGYVKEHLNNSRIFPLGVGSSPNRYLLEELAVLGKGTVEYVRQAERPEKLEKIAEEFHERVSRPVLTDLSVDWNGLGVRDAAPGFIPDLFSGQPLLLHARYAKAGSAQVTLRGKMQGKPWRMSFGVNLPEVEKGNAALGALWARARITELERLTYRGEDAGVKDQIIALALEHKLVTQYTSFVAVDESPADAKGRLPLLVPVESELPEGTRYEGFFGAPSRGAAVAAVRGGSFSQAKYSVGAKLGAIFNKAAGGGGAAYSAYSFRSADASGSSLDALAFSSPSAAAAQAEGQAVTLAKALLAAPSQRLLRQLFSLEDVSGSFSAKPAEQALVLLALAKAKAALGAYDAEGALARGWSSLRDDYKGLNARQALLKALKGSPYWTPDVERELVAQSGVLQALR